MALPGAARGAAPSPSGYYKAALCCCEASSVYVELQLELVVLVFALVSHDCTADCSRQQHEFWNTADCSQSAS